MNTLGSTAANPIVITPARPRTRPLPADGERHPSKRRRVSAVGPRTIAAVLDSSQRGKISSMEARVLAERGDVLREQRRNQRKGRKATAALLKRVVSLRASEETLAVFKATGAAETRRAEMARTACISARAARLAALDYVARNERRTMLYTVTVRRARLLPAPPPPARRPTGDITVLPLGDPALRGEACSICLSSYDVDPDIPGARLPCAHCYHGVCISTWFTMSSTCPLCRDTAFV